MDIIIERPQKIKEPKESIINQDELSKLTKKELIMDLEDNLSLPSRDSSCMTKKYLIALKNQTVMTFPKKEVNVYISKIPASQLVLRHKLRLKVETPRLDKLLELKDMKKTGWSVKNGFPDEK